MNHANVSAQDVQPLVELFQQKRPLLVVSGAGISTASGIPDYRDKHGEWKRKTPIYHQDFIDHHAVRQRYWARSLLGWRHFGKAQPNAGHVALARLEQQGFIHSIITQNVDQLHQRAGSKSVIDLHGRIGELVCLSCKNTVTRAEFQAPLAALNPRYEELAAEIAPDGDADLNLESFADFSVPTCEICGGVMMPDVVFYGGNVPKTRVAQALNALQQSEALLVVGSSLMVYSSYRFCVAAHEAQKPIGAINIGVTRADHLLAFKIQHSCNAVLTQVAKELGC